MSRGRVAAGSALVALGVAALAVALVAYSREGDPGASGRRARGAFLAEALEAQSPAGPPLGGFGEARVAVGGRCLLVAVADEQSERVQGLRGVQALGEIDGMLFVFDAERNGEFTMADTLVALDVGFYDSEGSEVDRERMVPCPEGDDGTCPRYGSREAYRFALEVPAGSLGAGALSTCT